MTVKTFDFNWSMSDTARTLEFQCRLAIESEEHFSSDDFRRFKLDRFMERPDKEIGTYFAKLKYYGYAEPVGEVPSAIESNHKRNVDLWRWKEKAKNIKSETLG